MTENEVYEIQNYVFEKTPDKSRVNLWVDASQALADKIEKIDGVVAVKLYGDERVSVRINPRYPIELVQAKVTELLETVKPWEA